MNTRTSVIDWLDHFAGCVRSRDIETGMSLFAPEVIGFGTRTEQANNLEELTVNQWSHIWHGTRDFKFLPESIRTLASDDSTLVCVLALWESQGIHADGRDFPRRGRCTIVLKPHPAAPHGLLAIHTHFSKTPTGEV